jgi:hypothetical protein
MAIYDFFLSRNNAASTPANYVGHTGRLFYDSETGEIRISDGVTPSGLSIPITLATETISGGVKLGPGVILNNDGQIIIDSTGVDFSFGDFQATVVDINGSDVAVLSSINLNEDIVIETNGTGAVEIVGIFNVHATNGTLAGSLADEPIFRVNTDGKVRMLIPTADEVEGALEIIGNAAGEYHPPNQTGVIIHATGQPNGIARHYLDANNNYPIIVGRRYNGTFDTLTPVLNGEIIFRLVGQASTNGQFETFGPARIEMRATQDQATGAQGAEIAYFVTPLDTAAANAIQIMKFNAETGVTTVDVNPQVTGTYDLGSPALRWRDLYTVTMNLRDNILTTVDPAVDIVIGDTDSTGITDMTNRAVGITDLTVTNPITGSISGSAGSVTNGVYTTGDQTIAGNKTFSGNTDLGANTNVKISGGLVGELLTSDGAGNLTWSLAPTATYYESSTQTPETFTPAPLTAISGLSLTAIAGTYRIESSIQYTVIPAKVSTELATDLTTLIATIDAQTSPISHAAGYGGNETITAGYYFVAGATTHTGNIIFDADGDPDATFIFKCGAAHALAVGATTSLINGAKASNIFWYVIGSLTLGASCDIQGTYIGSGAVAPGTPFSLEGRILTKTGAITMAEATFAVPVGIPSLNMGLLEEFAFFTTSGAISNTIIPGGIGDVNSGAGIISGFSEIEGIVYLADDTISEVEFELYQNNNRIASSLFSSKTQIFSRSQHATILGTATGGAGENIELHGRVLVGTLIANNRSIFALKLD